jgi:hypothetical protein
MPQALVDLAYTTAELKEEKAEMTVGPGGKPDPYSWGLNLRLEESELDKLGLKLLPQVGSEVHFMAVACVTNVSQSSSVRGDDETSVGLQIRMMQILQVEAPDEEGGEKETPAAEVKEMPRKGGALGI